MTLELPDRSDLIRSGVTLAPLTTYRFGGRARFYAEVADRDGLLRVLEAANVIEIYYFAHAPLLGESGHFRRRAR